MDGESSKPMSGLIVGDKAAHPQRQPLMFDPWLTTSSRLVEVLIDNLRSHYKTEIASKHRRQRKPKVRDAMNFERIFRAIYINLAYAAAHGIEPPAVAVSLRASRQKLTRYDARGFGMLPQIAEELSDHRVFVTLRRSSKKGVASDLVAPGGMFTWEVKGKPVGARPEYFGRQLGAEVIRLSLSAPHPYEAGEEDVTEQPHSGSLPVDYEDTTETLRLREEMSSINRHLASAKIDLEADNRLRMGVFAQRELRRYFKQPHDEEVPRFDLCGRMFGGWWQSLPKEYRQRIRINGETIADLDFRSMFLRLAYVRAGLPAPMAGDLYAGVWRGGEYREGLKKVVNAMFFRETPLTKLPKGTKAMFPRGASASEIRDAILNAHRPIAHLFETGCGLSLMFTESQILTAILLRLNAEGVTALPMHDGLMVARSHLGAARRAMEDVSEAFTGFKLPIKATVMPG